MDSKESTDRNIGKRRIRPHRWLLILFSILALLLFLLLLEGFLRLIGIRNPVRYEPVPTSDIFVHHDTLGWVLKPNAGSRHIGYEYDVFYTIDTLGHRLTPASVKDADLHVICLGGSMTFGHGLNDEETIPNRIAQMLQAKVWNMGIQGYATDQSMMQLRSSIAELQPDVVVLSYLPSHIERNACLPKWMNKLQNSGRSKPNYHLNGKELQLTQVPGYVDDTSLNKMTHQPEGTPLSGSFFLKLRKQLRSKSALYNWLRMMLWRAQTLIPQNPFPQYLDTGHPETVLTQEMIKAIRDLSEAHNSKFLLVLLPQRNYLNGRYNPNIYRAIQSFATRENIKHINLLSEMTEYHWTDIFYPEDGHFTPLGAQVAAQAISKTIKTMDIP